MHFDGNSAALLAAFCRFDEETLRMRQEENLMEENEKEKSDGKGSNKKPPRRIGGGVFHLTRVLASHKMLWGQMMQAISPNSMSRQKGKAPQYISPVVTSGGATPRR